MGIKEGAPRGGNGLGILRAMGNPILFDGRGSLNNLGVANKWVDLFDLTGQGDRVFVGIQVYNSDSAIPLYISFANARGSEVKNMMIEPNAVADIDELTFGPGFRDPFVLQNFCLYVRAMVPTASGTAAKGTATYSTNIADGLSFSLGSIQYFVKSAPGASTPAANQVFIQRGASLTLTLAAIAAAINANDPSVTATSTATVLTVISNYTGTGPNTKIFVDVDTTGTFTGSGTLGGSGAAAVGANGILVDANIW